jgi:acetyl-CoA carboxylase biotin carboxyl carrier protein
VIAATAAAPAAVPAAALAPAPAGADAPAAGSVSSPMVGTAYLSPEPNAAAFVKVGDRVAKGQTILIIEAMKVMNPIPAPHAGTVTQILVQDGQPVEFGEPLMVVA